MSGDALLAWLGPAEAAPMPGLFGGLLVLALVATCAVIVVVDARERIIPDGCNLLVAALGLAFAIRDGWSAAAAALVQGVVAFALFWLFRTLYRQLRGHHGLGLGDVKFLGAAGLWTGLDGLAPLILIACTAALLYLGAVRLRGGAVTAGLAIPFGPFLVVGLLGLVASRVL